MTITTIIILDAGLCGLVLLAHRLPSAAPHHDALWGRGENPWVVSDPLPLVQLAAHESAHELRRAA